MTTSLISSPPRAPDFSLPDHLGGTYRLRDHLGTGPIVVTFFRGHWCPYCRRYLTKFAANWPKFVDRGVKVVAISPEPPATSLSLAVELKLPFPILSDSSGSTIDAYGTRNGFRASRALLPHPSVFLLDREGTIRFRSIDRNYKKRTTLPTIFGLLDSLAPH